jgi:alpha-tubulin suppressor-like RCC1 family protein
MPGWYACGSNSTGVLGLGGTDDEFTPRAVIVGDTNVRTLATSGKHAIAITQDGSLLSAGDNEFGQCGALMSMPQVTVFSRVPLSIHVRKVALGWMQTFVLSVEGMLFACGSNSHGQLGLGTSIHQTESLLPLNAFYFSGASIIDVASGHTHTVAVTAEGAAFAWGTCRHGGLGIWDASGDIVAKTPVPLRISDLSVGTSPLLLEHSGPSEITDTCHPARSGVKYVQVACGWSHTLLLTQPILAHASTATPSSLASLVIAFGSSRHGQCGNNAPTGRGTRAAPCVVDMPAGLQPTYIDAGWNHSAAICTGPTDYDGKHGKVDLCLVTWGRCDLGQLGRPHTPQMGASTSVPSTALEVEYKFDAVPAIVPLPAARVLSVSCGSEHTCIITADGKALAFGWNEHGNVGCDPRECPIVYTPRVLPLPGNCIAIACGGATTFCCCDELAPTEGLRGPVVSSVT